MSDVNPPQDWEITEKEVNISLIQQAAACIKSIVPPTPVAKSYFHSKQFGLNIWFKLENFNVTGSFKIRGAANALSQAAKEDLKRGVVAASAGNHAQGVAYVSRILEAKAKIFMPERTPLNKVAATRDQGAEVFLGGAVYDDAYANAVAEHKRNGGMLIHAFSDAAVVNGQGTAGLEILDQIQNIGAIIIPVGGGGLSGGIACAVKSLKPDVKIIGVQTAAFPSMKHALSANKTVAVPAGATIADGIAVKRPSPRTLSLAAKYLDDLILVTEDEIAASIMNLMEKDHLLAEGAGAVGVAALAKLDQSFKAQMQNKAICCVISGGNIDVSLLSRIASRGLVASGRLMQLKVKTKDQPGQLAEILKALSQTGANLIEVKHHRNFGAMYYSDVHIELELETANFAHQEKILNTLRALEISVIGSASPDTNK